MGDSQYEVARRAWEAFRAPTPEALDQLRGDTTSPLPYLSAALTRFLQEYPWTRDGLSRTERRLLELAKVGEISLLKALPQMHQGEQAYYVTDDSLAAMAETLARTSPPLLRFHAFDGPRGNVLEGVLALMDAGQSALAGRLDRVAVCGIDRWFGGVHLEGSGPTWRWDDERSAIRYA